MDTPSCTTRCAQGRVSRSLSCKNCCLRMATHGLLPSPSRLTGVRNQGMATRHGTKKAQPQGKPIRTLFSLWFKEISVFQQSSGRHASTEEASKIFSDLQRPPHARHCLFEVAQDGRGQAILRSAWESTHLLAASRALVRWANEPSSGRRYGKMMERHFSFLVSSDSLCGSWRDVFSCVVES